jgi:transglutaminase-like putative cysteine protease
LRYLATVEVQPPETNLLAPELPLAQLPGQTLSYLQSSRYCEVEAIYRFAVRRFGNIRSGYQRVQTICQWSRRMSTTW